MFSNIKRLSSKNLPLGNQRQFSLVDRRLSSRLDGCRGSLGRCFLIFPTSRSVFLCTDRYRLFRENAHQYRLFGHRYRLLRENGHRYRSAPVPVIWRSNLTLVEVLEHHAQEVVVQLTIQNIINLERDKNRKYVFKFSKNVNAVAYVVDYLEHLPNVRNRHQPLLLSRF